MKQKKILATALVASTIAGIGIVPAQNAEAASLSSFVSNALAIANDNSHGYSMVNRWGPDYDCSSFVITCLKQAGFETGGATYSGNMVSNLTAHGWSYIPSTKINLDSSSSLQAGDILMASGHTEIYIGNGKRVGAHRNYDGKTGDSQGNEINVLNYSRGSWYGILRYTGSGSAATAVTTAATTTSSNQTGTYKVNANLNLRSGNSTGTSILTTLPKGTSVSVTQISNGWGKTTYGGKTGWIYLSYASRTGSQATTASTTKTTTATTAAATTQGTVYKTTANLNLRAGNSTGTSILTSLPRGTSITVTQISNNWGKVSYSGKTGWICLDYATRVSSPATTAAATTTKTTTASTVAGTVYKTNGSMYLRAGNNKSSSIIGLVPKGTSVTATQISNNWGKITYGGKTGWMSLKYSTKTGTVAAAPAAKKTTTASAAAKTSSATTAVSGTTSKTTSYIYHTTANVNLRSGNSTSHSKLTVVPRGTAVTVTEIKNNWGKISYGGKTGWLSLEYASKKGANVVTTITSVAKDTTSSSSKSVTYSYTTTANLNLRKSYSTSSAKILTMPNGTGLTVTEIKNNWGKVNYKGNVGWMSLQYAICTGSQTTVKNVIGVSSSTTTASAKTSPTLKTASVKATTSSVKTESAPATTSAAKAASVKATTSSVKTESVPAAASAETAVNEEKTTFKLASAAPVLKAAPIDATEEAVEETVQTENTETEENATVPAASEVTLSVVDPTASEDDSKAEAEETVKTETKEAVEETAEAETEAEEAVEETTEAETEAEEAVEETTEAETEAGEAVEETTEAETEAEEAVDETEEAETEEVEAAEEADSFAPGNYAAQTEIRIYADASEGAAVLTTFDAGTVLEVTEASDGWGKVRIEGQTCWIRLADFEKTSGSVTPDLKLTPEEATEAETDVAEETDADADGMSETDDIEGTEDGGAGQE